VVIESGVYISAFPAAAGNQAFEGQERITPVYGTWRGQGLASCTRRKPQVRSLVFRIFVEKVSNIFPGFTVWLCKDKKPETLIFAVRSSTDLGHLFAAFRSFCADESPIP
jgi:hypothetical protein